MKKSSPILQIWKRFNLAPRLKSLFNGWGAKEKVITPIIVNLLTALLLFVLAILFKPIIVGLFSPKSEIKEYPLYCIVEPNNNKEGKVVGDIFIINMTETTFYKNQLAILSKSLNPDPDSEINPDIHVENTSQSSKILSIEVDGNFNEDKGVVDIVEEPNNHWRISIERIEG